MASPSDNFDGPAEKKMAEAIVSGDVAAVREGFASGGVSLAASGRNGLGWLQLAIQASQRPAFDALLTAGAIGDPKSVTTGHAMYEATVADDSSWLKALHTAGASLDNRGGGELLLLSAARSKLPGRLAYFIENGADLEAATLSGDTALISTAKTGNYPAALDLLEAGASPWASSPRGHTIGFWLERTAGKPAWDVTSEAEQQRQQIIAILLSRGVPHPPPSPDEVLELQKSGDWGN